MKQDAMQRKRNDRKAGIRFACIMIAAIVAGFYVLGHTLWVRIDETSTGYWSQVKQRLVKKDKLEPKRGDILSADGNVMVSSLPEFEISMEYVVSDPDSALRVKRQTWRDSAYFASLDSISEGLANIFPEHNAQWFHDRLEKGRKRRSKGWPILNKRITFVQYLQCKELPLFREAFGKGGFNANRVVSRKLIYGSLAHRTLGDYKDTKDTCYGTSGLEHCYDSILRGKPGWGRTMKVRNAKVTITDMEPESGHDLVTTIDANLQDFAEKCITNKMREVGADKGVVIVMEAATGDVKAMVNMTRYGDAERGYVFKENDRNYAINGMWHPGSTFKTASMMVALDDGYITPDYIVDTGTGAKTMYGAVMKDHNWHKGMSVPRVLNVTNIMKSSSNVGVSSIIDKFYHDHPEKYVQGLNDLGVGIDLGMPMGNKPNVKMPQWTTDKKGNRHYTNWSRLSLPWMSIGYETQVPPISTLAFYNAIANNGKFMRPRFVTQELCDGEMVREFPPVVIKEKICKDQTLTYIRDILDSVVNAPNGTGKPAKSHRFHSCGKTGTAQIGRPGERQYLISFCGFFPSDAPKYSCIVCLEMRGQAFGGAYCGPVFKAISELLMLKGVYRNPRKAADSTSVFVPMLSAGSANSTETLLSQMNLPDGKRPSNIPTTKHTAQGTVPSVVGMGARDAVTLLQQSGYKAKINGKGHVVQQSVPAGAKKPQGTTITVQLK